MKRFFKYHWQTAVIIILAVVIAVQGVLLLSGGKGTTANTEQKVELTLDTAGLTKEVPEIVNSVISDITGGFSAGTVTGAARKIVFSDTVVNLVMSLSYPLLHDTLVNLDMLDFGEEAKLYGTGEVLAKYLRDKPYTCLDKDGTRKALSEVLDESEDDWDYMSEKVTYTDESGKEKTTTLWNSIEWGVADEESFYAVMADMSCGLRGVLEVCLQSKPVTVNVNAIEAVLGTDAVDIRLDAAVISNDGEKTGYEYALIPLFVMLGLDEGEYPSNDEFVAYTELSDIWRAIFSSVFKAVDKIAADPLTKLSELLVKFTAALETGSLCDGLRHMKMYGTFNKLASLAMGFEDKELFNLGAALTDIIASFGADISGNLNGVLDSIAKKLLGDSADLPDMDTAAFIALATKTQKSGIDYYTVTSDAATDFLIDYISSDAV
ncbi:MAG: hypothetical protein MJ177_01075, partial [Clostridia bacterium]|nr:hypothetical protein [Clostridia bacterium]